MEYYKKYKFISFYYIAGFWWFRIFGIGLVFKDLSIHEMSFSERNEYRKYLKFNSWIIRNLPRLIIPINKKC